MNAVLFYEELCLALKILLLVSLWESLKMILRSSKVVTGIVRCSRYYTRLSGVNVNNQFHSKRMRLQIKFY